MSRKKSTKSKTNISKPKSNIDINDIDAMLEDMKSLVIAEREKEEKVEEELPQKAEILVEDETEVSDGVEEQEEQVSNEETSMLESVEEETNDEILENTENLEEETEKPKEEIENTEDLSFVDEVKEVEKPEEEIEMVEEEKVEEKPAPKKPKRKTYQEMFGGTWRGYGYDHF